jgi:hypothetical protein
LRVAIVVEPSHRMFVPADTINELDNEPAGINGDGVQLYVTYGAAGGAWLLVPIADSTAVSARPVAGWSTGLLVSASWSATAKGYALDVRVPLPPAPAALALDVLVNEAAPGRERRRGQLVMSGADREFVYLRGDRHEATRLLRFTHPDV